MKEGSYEPKPRLSSKLKTFVLQAVNLKSELIMISYTVLKKPRTEEGF